MCFLGFTVLRFLTFIFSSLLAICVMAGICASINKLDHYNQKIQIILCFTLAFDLLMNVAIFLGLYGVIRRILKNIYLYICALVCFFVVKITVSKAIQNFDKKETDIIITFWYQLDVVLAGFCLITATPFSLKLSEKQDDIV
ncbi:uncharacterized protein LOC133843369 [Drosophila sulfurigaster albostrigata]|uniref:uncharacterized protein LOC133843369 n=1 Tax=Drosophila sulfurigaster albostrigata TaxID=89887 RepID=UPI002D218C09|nr:uncharacterized protein LOC133843369 [Drosophila sulfurigaster albostrigata]